MSSRILKFPQGGRPRRSATTLEPIDPQFPARAHKAAPVLDISLQLAGRISPRNTKILNQLISENFADARVLQATLRLQAREFANQTNNTVPELPVNGINGRRSVLRRIREWFIGEA